MTASCLVCGDDAADGALCFGCGADTAVVGGVSIIRADCVDAMRAMDAESVDAIVCDPPYGLSREPDAAEVLRHWLAGDDHSHTGGGFMGKTWDSFVPGPAVWREALRVLKPGGHLLAFGGPRTYDLLVLAVRLAGFEIRDSLHWIYGTGFPKSLSPYRSMLKGLCQSTELAPPAVRVSPWLGVVLPEVREPTALALVETLPGGNLGVAIRIGEEGGSPVVTVTSLSDWTMGAMSWNTVSSCRGYSAAHWKHASTPIIETACAMTTDPRTSNFSRFLSTLPAITQAACRAVGCKCSAFTAASLSSGGRWRSEHTHGRIASEPVTSPLAPLDGLGTAAKPAHEPIVVARKPLIGTVAANVERHGTGAINVDGCRVGTDGGTSKGSKPTGAGRGIYGTGLHGACEIERLDAGRWPPNVLISHLPECGPDDGGKCAEGCAVAEMDAQSGVRTSGKVTKTYSPKMETSHSLGAKKRNLDPSKVFSDSGCASRFFPCFRYIAKASKKERNAGLTHLPAAQQNRHPTVKPVETMRWLCRLVTPPDGVVLDPFMGSGTTGIAAVHEGFRFIGVEQDAGYAEIARRRVLHAQEGLQP